MRLLPRAESVTFLLATRLSTVQHATTESDMSIFYAPQTKILEGGTKDDIRIFEALFKYVSTRFGRLAIAKCIENPE